jgi:hypothetical protein
MKLGKVAKIILMVTLTAVADGIHQCPNGVNVAITSEVHRAASRTHITGIVDHGNT